MLLATPLPTTSARSHRTTTSFRRSWLHVPMRLTMRVLRASSYLDESELSTIKVCARSLWVKETDVTGGPQGPNESGAQRRLRPGGAPHGLDGHAPQPRRRRGGRVAP